MSVTTAHRLAHLSIDERPDVAILDGRGPGAIASIVLTGMILFGGLYVPQCRALIDIGWRTVMSMR